MTEWRTLHWLPNYDISEDGRVRRNRPSHKHPAGFVLKPYRDRHGYLTICLSHDSRGKRFLVHRLVCEAFHGPPPFEGAHAAHWDGDKDRNHQDNLRWATPAENIADKRRHGTQTYGETSGRAKTTWATVRQMRAEYTGAPGDFSRLARKFGVSPAVANSIIRNRTWREAA